MDDKIDARKLSAVVIEEKRRQVHLLRERGMTSAEIGDVSAVYADTAGRWFKLTVSPESIPPVKWDFLIISN